MASKKIGKDLATIKPNQNVKENETDTMPDVVQAVKIAEQTLEAMKQVLRLAVSQTRPSDWTDQNGKPYLQATGAEKVAMLFGISSRIVPQGESLYLKTEHSDGHYTIMYVGEFRFRNRTMEVVGSRSSSDPFFTRGGSLPPSEIDLKDIQVAAYSNLMMNGITRILGIRNLDWDTLRTAGLDCDAVSKVIYKKKTTNTNGFGREATTGIDITPFWKYLKNNNATPQAPTLIKKYFGKPTILKDALKTQDDLDKLLIFVKGKVKPVEGVE
jgi:hypothetical protein